MAISKVIYKASAAATPEVWMDATPATAAAADITAPKTAMLANGILTTGTGSGGGGGGGSATAKAVNFRDYDGTVVYSYTAAEFAQLSALPANPDHSGDAVPLTSQGWNIPENWTLANVKTAVAAAGAMDIGQMYVPTDGKTHILIHIDPDTPDNRLTFSVRYTQTVSQGVTVDWGDGTTPESFTGTSAADRSHTYAQGGDYDITLTVTSGKVSFVGTGTSSTSGNSIFGTRSNGSNTVNRGRIREVYIGSDVTAIGQSAFFYCYCLTSITIPFGVTSIGTYAFYNCYSLPSLTIPSSVTSIGTYAFYDCYSLTSITIPPGVTSIENYAFYNCYSLTSVTIPSGVTSIGTYAFYYCYSLPSLTIPSSVTSIGTYAFAGCYSLTSITIPSGVTSIETYTFYACYSLTSITIPSTVTSIGERAFYSCYSLTNITIPSSVTSIETYTFYACYNLTSITIPSTVTSIGANVFGACYSLTSVTIPFGVTSIGANVFGACYGVGEYYFLPTTPPTLADTNAFAGIRPDTKIYVPYSADHSILEAYQTATNWSTYASYMIEEDAP